MRLGVMLLAALACATGGYSSAPAAAAPAGLEDWAFLLGKWGVVEKRYGFDGKLIQTNPGEASFSPAMNGQRIAELITLRTEPEGSTALHVFVYDPRSEEIEIARTDSGHYGFWVIRGTLTAGRMDLVEKHPDPESEITRKITYRRLDDDHFVRQLEFSQDRGESWFVRSEWSYTRRE